MRSIPFFSILLCSVPLYSQTAVIYDFNFDVSPSIRQELPALDLMGQPKGHYNGSKWVPETTRETLDARYVSSMCQTLQAAVIDELKFDEVDIAYPQGLSMRVHPSRMDGFPKMNLKKASKQYNVDFFIYCSVVIKGRASGNLVVMNKQREASLKLNAEIAVTVYRPDGNIEETNSIEIKDLTAPFEEHHVAQLEDEFTRVMGVSFLSQSDIEQLFLFSLQKLMRE